MSDNWHSILDDFSDASLLIDAEHIVVFCNRAARALLNGDVTGCELKDIPELRGLTLPVELQLSALSPIVALDNGIGCQFRVFRAANSDHISLVLHPNETNTELSPELFSVDLVTNTWHLHAAKREVLGLPLEGILSTEDILVRMHQDDAADLQSQFDAYRESQALEVHLRCQLIDGGNNYRWFEISADGSSASGRQEAERLSGTIRDVTDQHLEERDQEMVRSRIHRLQKMESMSQLVGGIAHDFNNILGSIIGYTELALMETDPKGQIKLSTYLQEIFQGGRRARDLVKKMLMFSVPNEQLELQHLDVNEELRTTVRLLRATLPDTIEVSATFEENVPDVRMECAQLQQVILSLARNSREAMEDVGLIYVRSRTCSLSDAVCSSCHRTFEGEYVEVTVEDTGPGIASDILQRLFEPYATTKPNASGLGLSVVHGLVHNQGGHLLVDTIVGDGTEIRFFFKPDASPELVVDTGSLAASLSDQVTGSHRLLVVDDEVSLVKFLQTLLQRKGYMVEVATDSSVAWQMFADAPDRYDLVVTDQTMPELSGMELAQKILALRANTPIILCTGYSESIGEHNYSSFGIRGFLGKPLDSAALLRKIEELLPASTDE